MTRAPRATLCVVPLLFAGDAIHVQLQARPDTTSSDCREFDWADAKFDLYGSPCSHYAADPDNFVCGSADDDDFTAADMCCTCGGGDKSVCTHTNYGAKGQRFDCDSYQIKDMPYLFCEGNYAFDDTDFTAMDMCCSCGGGYPARTSSPTPAPATSATATDDPHLANLAGERFDVNLPGEHVFLRVPLDVEKPALLQLNATMEQPEDTACGVYIKMVTLSGEWLGQDTVRVRPRKRNAPGANSAGNQTLWEFSMQVSTPGATGRWVRFADPKPGETDKVFYKSQGASHSAVKAFAARMEQMGMRPESQTFRLELGPAGSQEPAIITIHQAHHQALNIAARHLDRLGHEKLGGLLGTEKHDRAVERRMEKCLKEKAMATLVRTTHSEFEAALDSASQYNAYAHWH